MSFDILIKCYKRKKEFLIINYFLHLRAVSKQISNMDEIFYLLYLYHAALNYTSQSQKKIVIDLTNVEYMLFYKRLMNLILPYNLESAKHHRWKKWVNINYLTWYKITRQLVFLFFLSFTCPVIINIILFLSFIFISSLLYKRVFSPRISQMLLNTLRLSFMS